MLTVECDGYDVVIFCSNLNKNKIKYRVIFLFLFAQTLPEYNKKYFRATVVSYLVWIKYNSNRTHYTRYEITWVKNNLTGYEMTLGTKWLGNENVKKIVQNNQNNLK